MGQEFFIKDETLESKVRELLPSQGGLGAGVDLSASTTIVPIVDLTESAQGSNLRQDLQTSLSFTSITPFLISNATTTIANNTGYFRIFGQFSGLSDSSGNKAGEFNLTDGATTKKVIQYRVQQNSDPKINVIIPFDFIVFLNAGDSLTGVTFSSQTSLIGNSRQVATIDGILVNPL
jgi:hypothetical protein